MFTAALLATSLSRPESLHSQSHFEDVTCDNGAGEYSSEFFTGATVSVGPLRRGAFAERACAAKLRRGSEEITVASDAAQVGIDVLGADLGFGQPVVAFQIDESGDGTKRGYQIYSLVKPLRLLYTISGADAYAAADVDLDGQVEIWTDDASAIDGFEGVPLKSFDSSPTVVLRFERKQLVDVSAEFVSHYDAQISDLRERTERQELAEFKKSNGTLSLETPGASEASHCLARTKIKVLEIVWAYLYSGREAEAWSALQDMWPANDFNRIRMKITDARQRGILRNINRAQTRSKHKHEVHIYDVTGGSGAVSRNVLNPGGGAPDGADQESGVVQPKSIFLRRPPPDAVEQLRATDAVMELLVDAAGKVHSARMLNGADKRWIQASAGWHFIPARREGSPVACRFRLSVWDLK